MKQCFKFKCFGTKKLHKINMRKIVHITKSCLHFCYIQDEIQPSFLEMLTKFSFTAVGE